MKKTKTALALPAREKLWFCLMYPLSAVVRLALLILPFRVISCVMGKQIQSKEPSTVLSEEEQSLVSRIGKVCALVARYTPWETKCLSQAILGRVFLGFYGISCVIYLGVTKAGDPLNPMRAHAWMKAGGLIVTGREGHRAFTVLVAYEASAIFPKKERKPDVSNAL
ncbi:lasso peptide biosynthesis B2 protein [Puniceicoccaceae bacterium K14]|nr:lasso peptide biosynthesis B2 protein [Puniceicoccaceae bacterium K14]